MNDNKLKEFEELLNKIRNGEIPFSLSLIKQIERLTDGIVESYYYDHKKRILEVDIIQFPSIETITVLTDQGKITLERK